MFLFLGEFCLFFNIIVNLLLIIMWDCGEYDFFFFNFVIFDFYLEQNSDGCDKELEVDKRCLCMVGPVRKSFSVVF